MIKIDDSYFVRYTVKEDDGTMTRRDGFSDSSPQRLLAKIKKLGLEHLREVTICQRHFITIDAEATMNDLRESGCTDAELDEMLPYLR